LCGVDAALNSGWRQTSCGLLRRQVGRHGDLNEAA
jgi:hypothetical protein